MNPCWIVLFVVVVQIGAEKHNCGLSKYNERIVGGHESKKLAWPWQAKLDVEFSTNRRGAYIIGNCGGSLIDSQWVLTAAHCFEKSKRAKALTGVKVVLGAHDMSKSDEDSRRTLQAVKVVTHDGYSHKRMKHDIALVKLERSLQFEGRDEQLAPVCLPKPDRKTEMDKCVATGWGRMSDGKG